MCARSRGQLVWDRRPPTSTVVPIVRAAKTVPAMSFLPLFRGASSSPGRGSASKAMCMYRQDAGFLTHSFGRRSIWSVRFASRPWEGDREMTTLAASLNEQFVEEGYVVVPGLLGDDDFEPLYSEWNQILDGIAGELVARGEL